MITWKHNCDRCGISVEQESHGLPPVGWFFVCFVVHDAARENVAGNSDKQREVCPDCLDTEIREITATVLTGLKKADAGIPDNYSRYNVYANIELRTGSR